MNSATITQISMRNDIRSLFLLQPDITYFNHGAFGAVPEAVMREQHRWHYEIERQPTEMIMRQAPALRLQARTALAEYLHAESDDISFITTATVGANVAARSLNLRPGDEVIGTDQEFAACARAFQVICDEAGAVYRQAAISVPVTTAEDLIDEIFSAVTPSTRALLISHITSPTALIFPVREICRRARAMGLLTIIDGSHAVGQIPLDLSDLGADIYIGILHKWLCAPKGTSFMYARRSLHDSLKPLVVGWDSQMGSSPGTPLSVRHEKVGTIDMSAVLSVPAAIRFQQEHNWDDVRSNCHELLRRARPLIAEKVGAELVCPESPDWYMQMCTFKLPPGADYTHLQRRLLDEHRIEIPVFSWQEHQMMRISVQGYNSWEDIERLLDALGKIMG